MRVISKDHLGNVFPSFKELVDFYKTVEYSTFLHRLDRGYSIYECLFGITKKGKKIFYNKKEYSSITQFCKEYNVSYSIVRTRLKKGELIQTIMRDLTSDKTSNNR